MIHPFTSRQPLISRMIFAPPCHFARRTHPFTVGVNPQADQQLRIVGRPTPSPSTDSISAVNPLRSSRPTNSQIARAV